jgi:hypothetical protein
VSAGPPLLFRNADINAVILSSLLLGGSGGGGGGGGDILHSPRREVRSALLPSLLPSTHTSFCIYRHTTSSNGPFARMHILARPCKQHPPAKAREQGRGQPSNQKDGCLGETASRTYIQRIATPEPNSPTSCELYHPRDFSLTMILD